MDAEAEEAALAKFQRGDITSRYLAIAPSWQRAWTEIISPLDNPPEVQQLIHATNAVGALNTKIRRAIGARGYFPSEDAASVSRAVPLNN